MARPDPPGILLVSKDAALEQVVRDAALDAPVMVAITPGAIADLLLSGRTSALILDATALGATAPLLADRLNRQFPFLPILAIGTHADAAAFAAGPSTGGTTQFLQRPLSPARTRRAIEAALRQRRSSTVAAPPRDLLRLGVISALAMGSASAWVALAHPFGAGQRPAPSGTPASHPPAAVIEITSTAARALHSGRPRRAAANPAPDPAQ